MTGAGRGSPTGGPGPPLAGTSATGRASTTGAWAVAAVLTVAGLLSLWLRPPPPGALPTAVVEVVLGAGFAAAGVAVLPRARVPGGLFLLAGALLLAALPAGAAGLTGVGDAGAVLAVALAVPLGLLRVVRRDRGAGVLRAVDAVVAVAGTVCTVATAAGASGPAAAAGVVVGTAVLVGGWVQFELTSGDDRRALLWLVVGVSLSLLTAALVRVRGTMDELLFGGRADAVDTLTRLGSELTAGTAPRDWLDTLRTALGVPWLALRADGVVVAESGSRDGERTEEVALRTGSAQVGDLVVALSPDQLRLPPATASVLGLVAAPLAQALHAVRLGEQLQASGRAAVVALEEQRRRMRRDLHDGLGPTLTGIAYTADAAANLVRNDPEQAADLLRGLRADAGEAIAEVRRIVHGLRPRALDELGLVGAVRQQVARLRAADGRPLRVDVHADGALDDLPAALEVVAYRVAVEAVTNVARHAGVAEADVALALRPGEALTVTVTDRGRSERAWEPGVGLRSMRERVEQIGGTLAVDAGPGGATVAAVLPLGAVPDR